MNPNQPVQVESSATPDGSESREAFAGATSCVGIFWFVMSRGRAELAGHATPWPEAEDYGDFKTEPRAHYAHWPVVARALKVPGEYEDWPRGRVVYNTRDDRFIVYIDRQLAGDGFKARLLTFFALPPERTLFAFDAHYSGARFKVRG